MQSAIVLTIIHSRASDVTSRPYPKVEVCAFQIPSANYFTCIALWKEYF